MHRLSRPWLVLGYAFVLSLRAAEPAHVVASPDGCLQLAFSGDQAGRLAFTLTVEGREVIGLSPLGLALGDGTVVPAAGWRVARAETRSVDEVWHPVWGKRAVVRDRYHELTLEVQSGKGDLRLVARAYDDGVAFRYDEPAHRSATRELTQFNFAGDYSAWFYNGERHNLGPTRLSECDGLRLPVMTVEATATCFLAVHEANLSAGDPLVLQARKGTTTMAVASRPSPAWRVILCGRTPGVLVDSHLIELLNPPASPGMAFDWVKPGVAVWDWRTNGAKIPGFTYTMDYPSWVRLVDFAAENGFAHLQLDADWYGPEFSKESDPTKGDKAAKVRELIAYGRRKGVGILLYLNDVGGRQYPLEEILKNYSAWGAAGIKYGFMKGSPAEKNERTRLITALCARYRLVCNFHDGPVHPYGQIRTWPNAVTREYCHSQLDAHRVFTPKTFVTSVFVNMLAGPIDMCNGLADLTQAGRVDQPSPVPSTLTGEAARTLIVFSGATLIPDIPENYRKHPELLQFLAAEKMPWRESRTLSGVIGDHIVMARQAADGAWLVGAATNEDPRELDVPLTFLGAGRYQALVIQDGADSDYRTHRESYRAEQRSVTRADSIRVKLAPGGGACVLLRPGS